MVGPLVWIVLQLVGLLAIGLLSCQYVERPRSHFDTYAEMELAGMIEAGWIPPYLPRSATDIHEGHDIDTNEVWATFKYDVGDTGPTKTACTLVVAGSVGQRFICPPYEEKIVIVTLRNDGRGSLVVNASGI